ncbi:hypothetical protein QF001_001459 [Paraburkholderia youngii]
MPLTRETTQWFFALSAINRQMATQFVRQLIIAGPECRPIHTRTRLANQQRRRLEPQCFLSGR